MGDRSAVVAARDTPRVAPEREPRGARGFYPEIFLVSFGGLLLEIGYTRIISFKLFYYYTYFVIGLALLGIGAGAVLVTVSSRLRRATTETVLAWSLLLGAASVGVGYVIIAVVSLNTFAIWRYGSSSSLNNLGLLLLICLALFASFVPIGVVTATLFSRTPERINRLYFADLIGAGLAGAVVVALLSSIGAPATVLLAGVALAAAALRVTLKHRLLPVTVGLIIVLGACVVSPSVLPAQQLEAGKAALFPPVTVYSKWSPIFRVDAAVIPKIGAIFLYHDGLLGSAIYQWNGTQSALNRFDFTHDLRSLPFAVSDATPRRELIIGAAGGKEVLTSLYYHVGHTDAVELNPVTYNLVTDRFASYDGHLADHRGVNYVNGDGRSYLARSSGNYNLIWYPAPDSYSATNASQGAFVLSESYLYTSNAIVSSLDHLAPGGVLATQFGEVDYEARPNRTTRYVATVRHALARMGVTDPSRHIMVATSKSSSLIGGATESTILVKRTPFSAAEVHRFSSALSVVPGSVLRYAPDAPSPVNSVSTIVTASSSRLQQFYNDYPYNVRPISDNDPYFWHFARFDDVLSNYTQPLTSADLENIQGERVLLLLLFLSVLLAAVFLLVPFLAIRTRWQSFERKWTSGVFFVAVGFGFFFFEITLIQRLILFLGYPTYALTVALSSLLIFVGVGAYLSGRIRRPVPARVLPGLAVAISGLTAFYLFGLPPLTRGLLGLPLAARVPVAFAVLAPLGICLGLFMPLGLGAVDRLGGSPREYVAWGWALNGFASVVGATLTTVLSMTFGFDVVLALALGLYLIAIAALHQLTTRVPAPAT